MPIFLKGCRKIGLGVPKVLGKMAGGCKIFRDSIFPLTLVRFW